MLAALLLGLVEDIENHALLPRQAVAYVGHSVELTIGSIGQCGIRA